MRNRYLFWFCASYIAASVFTAVFTSFLAVVLACAAFVAITGFFLCKCGARASAALAVLGIALSLIWQSVYFESDKISPELLSKEISVRATVVSFSEETTNGGISFNAKIEDDETDVRLLVYASENGASLSPGDIVQMNVRIHEFEDTEFFAERTYYKSRHIDAEAFTDEVDFLGKHENSKLLYMPQYVANSLKERADLLFCDSHSAFIKSLILGDTGDLDRDFKEDLRRTGLSHIVSVSGMHIAFLVGFLVLFTKNRYIKLLAIPLMFCFAIMVGASQSALRAVIMQTLVLLSHVQKREYDSLTSVSFAAFVLVFANPYCITDVGFLLSFSATLGIILLFKPIFSKISVQGDDVPKWKRKVVNSFASAFAVTVSAILFTAPITAYSFGSFSLIAPLSNVLLNFVIMCAFIGGFATLILSFIWFPLGKGAAFILGSLIELIIKVIRLLSKISFAEVFAGDLFVLLAVCFICFVIIYSILAGKKVRALFAVCAVCVVLASLFISRSILPKEEYEGIRFDVLDVGQGQCIVATSGEDCVIIDCGGDKDADNIAISHLLRRRITDIDALILTHAHSDHANGAKYLAETIDTKTVYMPATDKDNATFIKLSEEEDAVFVEEDTKLSFSGMEISILTLPEGKDENENGLVIVVSDGEYDLLITGDIPSRLEELIVDRIPDCESFVLGHHGSKTSSSQALINKALPELCLVSVGEGNSYGHPSSDTIARIEKLGSEIHRTDLEGDLTFYSR